MAKPSVVILATGGTIAGRADLDAPGYTSGVLNVDALVSTAPQIRNVANVLAEQIANIGSQDMNDSVWLALAHRIAELRIVNDERSLRYLEWTTDPDPTDETYIVDYAYLLRDIDGTVQVKKDRHIEGLFARADWLRLLTDVGFETDVVPFEHSEFDNKELVIFVGKKRQPETTT